MIESVVRNTLHILLAHAAPSPRSHRQDQGPVRRPRRPAGVASYDDLARLFRKGSVFSTTTTWVFRAGPVVGRLKLRCRSPPAPVWTSSGPMVTAATTTSLFCERCAPAPCATMSAQRNRTRRNLLQALRKSFSRCSNPNPAPARPRPSAIMRCRSISPTVTPPESTASNTCAPSALARNASKPSAPARRERSDVRASPGIASAVAGKRAFR